MMLTYIILVLLIAIGLYDLYRVYSRQKTISQKVHSWTNRWGDAAILIGIMGVIWWQLGPGYFTIILCGVILGHFFWQDES